MWSDNEAKEDLLGFEYLASAAVSIVKTEKLLPATIGIFGDWGGGKSTLIEIVKAQLTSREELDAGVVVLSFNGWLFEGYEGAKTALMGTILEELQEHETFVAKASDKAKSLLKSLYRRVDWMKATLGLTKIAGGIASAAHGGSLLVLSGGTDLATVAKDAKEFIEDAPKNGDKEESETRRQIQNFRKDFEALLKEANISRLVIIIDDLDRCSPDTIIPTLEAIKLFLFVPKTAFIIGADEELVRYAVRRRFPELPGDRREVGRDYLEKLIQFPIRIPALGRAEVESYLGLLFVTANEKLTAVQKDSALKKAAEANIDSLTTSTFNASVARSLFEPIPQELDDELIMVERLAPLLGTIMNGNPRQCKRFLNTLLLRLTMARSRKITLQQRVLAKLMLLEYFRTESFKRLAEIQFDKGGMPDELRLMEAAVRQEAGQGESVAHPRAGGKAGSATRASTSAPEKETTPEKVELTPEFALWVADPWLRGWLSMEPSLAEIDLKPYFFFSRDNLGMLGTAGQRLSIAARRVLDKIKSPSDAVRMAGLKEAKQLSEPDVNAVFEALVERAKREEDLGADNSSLKPMIEMAQDRPALLTQLIGAIKTLPEASLPIWVTVSVQQVCKGNTEAESAFRDILTAWSKGTINPQLALAAKSTITSITR
jgi:hypothetical protein